MVQEMLESRYGSHLSKNKNGIVVLLMIALKNWKKYKNITFILEIFF